MSDHIYTFEDFTDRVYENSLEYPTAKEAYEATEREHIEKYGQRKYANHQSYRRVVYYYLKKRRS